MFVKKAENIKYEKVNAGDLTSRQILIGPDEAPNFAMRKFTISPGGGMPSHKNMVEHEQYVLEGRATIGINGERFEVKKGDVVYIPAGVVHWYENEGKSDFIFLCIVPNTEDEITLISE